MAGGSDIAAVRVRISGRTQGVWFRGWTVEEATARGVRGWVRNRRDGTVEALFAGAPDAVDGMVEACWWGPPAARVTGLECAPAEDPGAVGFSVRPTV